MTNIMVDLETIDTSPTSAIISIGAVYFDEQTVYTDTAFYRPVDMFSSIGCGLTHSDETLGWWGGRSEEARSVFTDPHRVSLPEALSAFALWISPDAKVWGNGAAFDNAILAVAYRAVGLPLPWKFWNDRCYRTATAGVPRNRKQQGVHHNARDDAISQAFHLVACGKEYIR